MDERDEFDALDDELEHSLKIEHWDIDVEVSLSEEEKKDRSMPEFYLPIPKQYFGPPVDMVTFEEASANTTIPLERRKDSSTRELQVRGDWEWVDEETGKASSYAPEHLAHVRPWGTVGQRQRYFAFLEDVGPAEELPFPLPSYIFEEKPGDAELEATPHCPHWSGRSVLSHSLRKFVSDSHRISWS